MVKNLPAMHTVKGFGIVNQAEIDVFLELSCFFPDPTDGGYLISGLEDPLEESMATHFSLLVLRIHMDR